MVNLYYFNIVLLFLITFMIYKCYYCEKKIQKYSTLYFGYDCMWCSNHCRVKIIDSHIKLDEKLAYPHLWVKNRIKPQKIPDNVIPRIQSLSELIINFNII